MAFYGIILRAKWAVAKLKVYGQLTPLCPNLNEVRWVSWGDPEVKMGVHFENGGTYGRLFEISKVGGHYHKIAKIEHFNKIFGFYFLFLSVKMSMVPGELRLKIFQFGLKIPG